MTYRTFPERIQPQLEAKYPERFGDGSGWIAIAELAVGLGGVERYTPEEWEQVANVQPGVYQEPVVASSLWRVYVPYETERLKGRFVTQAGLKTLKQKEDEYEAALRQERDPHRIKGLRAAIDILYQAQIDPDRRKRAIDLMRDWDVLGIALYRPAPTPPRGAVVSPEMFLMKSGCYPSSKIEYGSGWRLFVEGRGSWLCKVERKQLETIKSVLRDRFGLKASG